MKQREVIFEAERIAAAIPQYQRPLLLLVRANKSRAEIRGWARMLVRQNTRNILSAVDEGRIAKKVISLLGLNKRRKHARKQ